MQDFNRDDRLMDIIEEIEDLYIDEWEGGEIEDYTIESLEWE